MTERPILFSAPMIRAILAGQKTQTRRVLKEQPQRDVWPFPPMTDNDRAQIVEHCPYGVPGDRLWVRESWRASSAHDALAPAQIPRCDPLAYAADGEHPTLLGKGRPSIHMPRWASRITLEITGVRVERLQAISEADALAEGCSLECMTPTGDDSGSAIHGPGGFHALWASINGAESWDANPWVWCISFRRI